jgi:hypothetical protein
LARQLAQGSAAGVEYAVLFRQLLTLEFVRDVIDEWPPRLDFDGKVCIGCDVHVKPPVAIIAEQMAAAAKQLASEDAAGIATVQFSSASRAQPKLAVDRPKANPSPQRPGRPQTITPELRAEAKALFERLGSWKAATRELNKLHNRTWKESTVEGWSRYSKRRGKETKRKNDTVANEAA